MAETIITLDKSLKESQLKFLEEDKNVYLELFKTEEDLVTASTFRKSTCDGVQLLPYLSLNIYSFMRSLKTC